MQNRWKSWGLWVSVASLIGFILKTYLKVEIAEYDTFVNMMLNVLVLFGIINNPEKKGEL
jgi:uncharacterized membrane protein